MTIRIEIDNYFFKYFGDPKKPSTMWRVKLVNDSGEVLEDIRTIQNKSLALKDYEILKNRYPDAKKEVIDLRK